MLRRISLLLMFGFIIAGITGCRQIIVSEVLQQPLGKKIYLKQNIWYENPGKISCLNYQKGKILTFGTEVEPLSATDYSISFKTADGKEFTIDYESSLTMLPMEAFIKQIFILKTRDELTKGMKEEDVKLMLQGKVKRGMTKEQVIIACGAPAACRTPSQLNSTWVYWRGPDTIYRIVFRKGRVNTFVDIDDKAGGARKMNFPKKSENNKK